MSKRKTDVCCPQCGESVNAGRVRDRWFVDCINSECQAFAFDVEGQGKSKAAALDEYVRQCEVRGFTRALEQKLKAIVEGAKS